MKYKGESIVSREKGRQLYEVLPDDHRVGHIHGVINGQEVHLDCRRCSVGMSRELSGGVVVKAYIYHPLVNRWGRRRRLRPGWTEEQFIRAASRCYEEARQEARRLHYADGVEEQAKELKEVEGFVEAVEAEIKRSGRSDSYHDMTISEMQEWSVWMEKWRMEQEEVR